MHASSQKRHEAKPLPAERIRDIAHELKAETLSALRPRQGTKPALRGHSGFQTYEAINAATASGILWAGEACPSLAKTA